MTTIRTINALILGALLGCFFADAGGYPREWAIVNGALCALWAWRSVRLTLRPSH